MATQISLKNLSSSNLSVDIKLDEDRAIRARLAPGASQALSKVQLDELDANAELQALISAGKVELQLTDGPVVTKRFSFVASAPADVLLLSSLEHKMQLLDAMLIVSTGGTAASTATLRDAAAGGGSALTSAMAQDAAGRVADASTATNELASGSSLFLNRSTDDSAGELVLTLQRLS